MRWSNPALVAPVQRRKREVCQAPSIYTKCTWELTGLCGHQELVRVRAISLVERARVCVEAAVRVHAAVRVERGVAPAARERAVRGDLQWVVARLAADEALARELRLDASLVRIDVLLVLRARA